jgi:DHA1 family 2-module integral membrane pump EmrD-like MFS transporter
MSKNKSVSLLMLACICVGLSLIVRLGTSVFLPALPIMEDALSMSPRELSLTISVYWVVFAFSALFVGPFADRKGRRPVLILSCFSYFLGSLVCGLSDDQFSFILGRLIQSVGGSAIPVVIVASIKDRANESEFINIVGWISTIASLGPLAAPIIGGYLAEHFSWRACFYFLAVSSLIIWVLTVWKFPESPVSSKKHVDRGALLLKNYISLLKDRKFVGVILANFSCFLLQGLYLTVSPFLFIDDLGLTSKSFGATSIIVIFGLVSGKFLCSFSANKFGPRSAFLQAAALTSLGGLMILGFWLLGSIDVATVLISTFILCLGFGGISPLTLHAISSNFSEQISTVVALNNALSLCAAAFSAYLAGVFITLDISNTSVLAVGAAFGGLACLIFAWSGRRHLAIEFKK